MAHADIVTEASIDPGVEKRVSKAVALAASTGNANLQTNIK